ncbi:iron-containing alcohol dehydrogenase [Bosea sp. BH3]|uniref:iron-containing alcohol dehydrogenase n=1 Tax=Bosea sp. BH3 TaxID=2871701 RepID=UPI0021CB3076|nr:iron-containing alcohol dehydrogenase [Bosea sp. BH3]MCU4180408.1 iron-containing alcohol dehydrogenase [Bosea sp. BH3]
MSGDNPAIHILPAPLPTAWPEPTVGAVALLAAGSTIAQAAVVTTPSPWRAVQPMLTARPARQLIIASNHRSALDRAAQDLSGPPTLVGIGGGLAMDAAKYIAKVNRQKLIQLPGSAANNACFTRTAWVMDGETRTAERNCPIPDAVLVVPELIAAAPDRLNRAGFAEILCSHTALFDWSLGHEAGHDVQWDEGLRGLARAQLAALDTLAPGVAAGELSAFLEIVTISARFAPGFASHPKARFNAGSEHIFAWALEAASGGTVLHGEAVGLGTVLMALLQDNDPARAAQLARSAGLPLRPEAMGASWAMVEGLAPALAARAAASDWYTVLNALGERLESAFVDAMPRLRALIEDTEARTEPALAAPISAGSGSDANARGPAPFCS